MSLPTFRPVGTWPFVFFTGFLQDTRDAPLIFGRSIYTRVQVSRSEDEDEERAAVDEGRAVTAEATARSGCCRLLSGAGPQRTDWWESNSARIGRRQYGRCGFSAQLAPYFPHPVCQLDTPEENVQCSRRICTATSTTRRSTAWIDYAGD